MAGLFPWKKKTSKIAGNGSQLVPARDFPSLLRQMQSHFDGFLEQFADRMLVSRNGETNGWRWGVEMEDREDAMVVRAEAPGFECGDFDVQIQENQLVLRASKKSDSKKNGQEYREERECYESIPLPSGIEKEKIDARYHNGVLTITLPKSAVTKAKRIAVKG